MNISNKERIYGELRRRIMSGVYPPGEKLREEHIAAEMSVSRTPVRTAIQRLIADGLVKNEEHKGAEVIGYTDRDLAEIFELRLLLEPYVASVASEHATEAQIQEMEVINEEMFRLIQSDQDDRIKGIQSLNNQFHHLLTNAAQSGRLRSLVEKFIDTPIIIGSFYFYTDHDMLQSYRAHREIIAALKLRDRQYAEIATRFHLTASHRLFKNQRATKKP